MTSKLAITGAVLGAALLASAPANARWWHHHGWGWGGPAAGFAAGAVIGSALAAPYYYGPPAYAYAPGPPPYAGDPEAYCESRFRSYDPASRTYMGYDGRRHPCP